MDRRIFVLHDTHDTIYDIDGGNSNFYFENPDDAIIFLKTTLFPQLGLLSLNYDEARILDVPLPHIDTDLYWSQESKEIKSRVSFKMPLPVSLNDYVLNERYVLYYDGHTTRTFVIDVKRIFDTKLLPVCGTSQ